MGAMKDLLIRAEESGIAAATSAAYGLDPEYVEEALLAAAPAGVHLRHGEPADYDADACEARMQNPLALTASDLVAVGWDSPDGSTWNHKDHGNGHGFYTATSVEASKLDLCGNPLDVPEDF
jgi:hypothetical protein